MDINFRIKEMSPAVLLEAYKPDEIRGHCSTCGNHAQVWSCPPHAFDPVEFLKGFNFVYVMIAAVSLKGFDEQGKAIEHYYAMRQEINRAVLKLETMQEGAVALFAGHCDACDKCTRSSGEECLYPGKCRYSLESLGVKVSDIMEHHFNEKLQWAKGKTPEKLLTVPALLTTDPMDTERILAAEFCLLND
jgi:predicted metal-binding protein